MRLGNVGRPQRWSVARRLVLGFFCILGLLLILAAGGLHQLNALVQQADDIVDGHNRRSDLAHRVNGAQLVLVQSIRASLLLTDAEDLKTQEVVVANARSGYFEAEKALGEVLQVAVSEAVSLLARLAEVRQLNQAISSVYDAALRIARGGSGVEGSLALLLPAEGTELQWRREIATIVDEATRAGRAEVEVMHRCQKVALLVVASIAALAVVATALLAIALVHIITRPIARAIATAEGIAQGRLDESIDETRQDEFGRLAIAMREMQGRLRESALAMRQSAGAIDVPDRYLLLGTHQRPQRSFVEMNLLHQTGRFRR